jgi:prevent-host-death family protein
MNDSHDVPVAATEVRLHFAEHLDRARLGEEFVITRNGRVTARLGPIEEETPSDDQGL